MIVDVKFESECLFYAGGVSGWGGGGIVNLSDGEEVDVGGGWVVVDEFVNEENMEFESDLSLMLLNDVFF